MIDWFTNTLINKMLVTFRGQVNNDWKEENYLLMFSVIFVSLNKEI